MLRRFAVVALLFLVAPLAPAGAQDSTRLARTPADTGTLRTKKPDLELQPTRSIDLDTDEGTWISLDVSPGPGSTRGCARFGSMCPRRSATNASERRWLTGTVRWSASPT